MKIKRSSRNQKTNKNDWRILFNIAVMFIAMQGVMFLFIQSMVDKI